MEFSEATDTMHESGASQFAHKRSDCTASSSIVDHLPSTVLKIFSYRSGFVGQLCRVKSAVSFNHLDDTFQDYYVSAPAALLPQRRFVQYIFTARGYASVVLGVVILSVCPSVCPSVTRVLCD